MPSIRTLLFALVFAALVLLSGCASPDGPKLTWKQRWREMAERQDADARAFVRTD